MAYPFPIDLHALDLFLNDATEATARVNSMTNDLIFLSNTFGESSNLLNQCSHVLNEVKKPVIALNHDYHPKDSPLLLYFDNLLQCTADNINLINRELVKLRIQEEKINFELVELTFLSHLLQQVLDNAHTFSNLPNFALNQINTTLNQMNAASNEAALVFMHVDLTIDVINSVVGEARLAVIYADREVFNTPDSFDAISKVWFEIEGENLQNSNTT
jgi:hypothetical protein